MARISAIDANELCDFQKRFELNEVADIMTIGSFVVVCDIFNDISKRSVLIHPHVLKVLMLIWILDELCEQWVD